MLGGVLRAEGPAVNSTNDHSCPHKDHFLVGGKRKQEQEIYGLWGKNQGWGRGCARVGVGCYIPRVAREGPSSKGILEGRE